MYSEIYNSCPKIGQEFIGLLQTKQLTSLLDLFWLSPSGELFEVCTPWANEKEKRTGAVKPYRVTGILRLSAIYRNQYKEVHVYFRCGVLHAVLPKNFNLHAIEDFQNDDDLLQLSSQEVQTLRVQKRSLSRSAREEVIRRLKDRQSISGGDFEMC